MQLGHDLRTYIGKRQRDLAISQGYYFHETSHTYAKFRENKILTKISEFAVCGFVPAGLWRFFCIMFIVCTWSRKMMSEPYIIYHNYSHRYRPKQTVTKPDPNALK